jgi:prephenate dehydrogenase
MTAHPALSISKPAITPVRRLGVIGCGLMGGSFALAMRSEGLAEEIIGYGQSATTLELAAEMGVIDAIAPSAEHLAASVDLLLVAVPVVATESTFKAVAAGLKPETLVMDVGSTKRDVVDTARRVFKGKVSQFVPAHPIAGSERAGVRHADVALYHDRQVILTPIAQTRPDFVERASQLWQGIGARVLQMSAENHDAAFAAVSHLPHLLAFAYFSAIANQPAGPEFLALAGPGFRDFTRIAASDPSVWRDILMTNREEVMRQSLRFRYALDTLERMMQDGDAAALEEGIRTASEARARWHIGGRTPR